MSDYLRDEIPIACLNCGYDYRQSIARLDAALNFTCIACGYWNKLDTKQTRELLLEVLKNGGDDLRYAMRRFATR